MLKLAALVVGLVFLVHYGPSHVAEHYANPAAAERAWFYVAQGFKGVVLWAVVAALTPRRAICIPVWAGCAWGFFEDSLVVSCRLARGIESVPVIGPWQGICGDPWYLVGLCVGLLAASAVAYGASRGRGKQRG